jgi:hypothetical protein
MNIMDLHKQTIEAIYSNAYYVTLFEISTRDIPEPTSLEEVHNFWNEFWYALPDTSTAQRGPWSDICTLSEGEYLA